MPKQIYSVGGQGNPRSAAPGTGSSCSSRGLGSQGTAPSKGKHKEKQWICLHLGEKGVQPSPLLHSVAKD